MIKSIFKLKEQSNTQLIADYEKTMQLKLNYYDKIKMHNFFDKYHIYEGIEIELNQNVILLRLTFAPFLIFMSVMFIVLCVRFFFTGMFYLRATGKLFLFIKKWNDIFFS